jgi:hypothetical protein
MPCCGRADARARQKPEYNTQVFAVRSL